MKRTLLLIFVGLYMSMNSQLYNAGTMFEVYHDIDPDTLLNYAITPYTNETYGFNLFDDNNDDLQIVARGAVSSSGSSAFIRVTSLNQNLSILFGRWDSVFVAGTSGWDVTKIAKALIVTDPIDAPDAVWDNTTLYLTDHSGHSGGNKNVNDFVGMEKFIGFRYDNNGNYSYGWIRVKCATEDSCYVKDISYSALAIGISENDESSVDVFPNPSAGNFYIRNADPASLDLEKLSLTDILGRKVNFSFEHIGKDIKIVTETDLKKGCYFLKYVSENRNFSNTLVKTFDD
ncbi:MAG: T9SS type A sorting domain-containing protein [Bacteroidota bacterium]